MKKRLFCSLRRALALLLALCLPLGLAAGCGQKAAQPGLTYAEVMAAANQQLGETFYQEVSFLDGWRQIGGHLLALGMYLDPQDPQNREKRRDHLLVDLDPDTGGYTCLQLQLPEVDGGLPQLQQALADQAAGQLEEGLLPTRSLNALLEDAGGRLCLLLADTLYQQQPGEDGLLTNEVLERQLTLCSLNENSQLQPLVRLDLQDYAA